MAFKIRRAQLIAPFGVGSMQVFEDGSSLMVGRLDEWRAAESEMVSDRRLSRLLNGRDLKLPPEEKIPLFRFPRWHYCYLCKMMREVSLTKLVKPICDSGYTVLDAGVKKIACRDLIPKSKRNTLTQMRFVIACSSGHIEDFPWREWLGAKKHGGNVEREKYCCEKNPVRLKYSTSGIAGLGNIGVLCMNCGTFRSLSGAGDPKVFTDFKCIGYQPWLGGILDKGCEAKLQLIQRGASNAYFPETISSILIPPFSEKMAQIIEKQVDVVSMYDGTAGEMKDTILKLLADRVGVSPATVEIYMEHRNSENVDTDTDENYRFAEYKALVSHIGREEDLFLTQPQKTENYASWISNKIDEVVLVEKLAETRVLRGFSRIYPAGVNGARYASLSLKSFDDWLPANRVYGEGVFINLDKDKLREWSQRTDVIERVAKLKRNYDAGPGCRIPDPLEITPSLILLHSLSHLLIKQLIFESGYGSASLRERLYYSNSDGKTMQGVLIYTASGDSEGGMGGLVQQGKHTRLNSTIQTALLKAAFCSSDPVCEESQGQGREALNLAACHACMLLPETSCEMGNILLDRLILVGTPENPSLGFWGEDVSSWLSGEE